MNLLLDKFPQDIVVNNIRYPIKTNFREWIKFEKAFMDDEDGKEMILSDILYGIFPDDGDDTIKKIMDFYQCGLSVKQTSSSGQFKRIYDYEEDQFLIYTAFLQYYQIDLNKIDYLHWWQFRQMFVELPEESKMKKVMLYRSISITSDMSKEQKSFYAKMKHIYALKEKGRTMKKANSFGAILAKGMNIKEL